MKKKRESLKILVHQSVAGLIVYHVLQQLIISKIARAMGQYHYTIKKIITTNNINYNVSAKIKENREIVRRSHKELIETFIVYMGWDAD